MCCVTVSQNYTEGFLDATGKTLQSCHVMPSLQMFFQIPNKQGRLMTPCLKIKPSFIKPAYLYISTSCIPMSLLLFKPG